MANSWIGTQIGPDGKRFELASPPSEFDDVVPERILVYGTPDTGKVIAWQNGKARWVSLADIESGEDIEDVIDVGSGNE